MIQQPAGKWVEGEKLRHLIGERVEEEKFQHPTGKMSREWDEKYHRQMSHECGENGEMA